MATKINPPGASQSNLPDYKIGDGIAKKADLISESLEKQKLKAKSINAKEYDTFVSDGAKQRATEYKKALQVAKSTPDIREDKVAKFKSLIENGQYKVDAGKVADGILTEAIKDQVSTVN